MTQQDTGFYARTPRIVRTEYKHLLASEKWLYTCLKDLCGDKGICFRSLRSLSAETDISIGSLSKMIPHLHEAGLIHAEKKSRGAGGKEVWHITIVDIWQANALFCTVIPKMNENGERCSETEHVQTGVVQNVNRVVQNMNENSECCSENERSCSEIDDRRRNNEEESRRRKGEEEQENEAPFSCSLSLSENAPSQEQVTTRSEEEQEQQQQNALLETASEYKTDEQPESKNLPHVPTPEKKTPPAWIEHLPKVRSTQYKMPDRLFGQRSEKQEGQVPEPKPLTKNEQRYLNEQERAAIWKVIEEEFHTTFTYGVRTHILNTKGMDAMLADHFTPDDVKKALTSMEAFHKKNLLADFSLEKLHRRLPGLLAAKEEVAPSPKPAAYSSRPLDITPQPGGWGRRLDGAMMPGVGGRVRHD